MDDYFDQAALIAACRPEILPGFLNEEMFPALGASVGADDVSVHSINAQQDQCELESRDADNEPLERLMEQDQLNASRDVNQAGDLQAGSCISVDTAPKQVHADLRLLLQEIHCLEHAEGLSRASLTTIKSVSMSSPADLQAMANMPKGHAKQLFRRAQQEQSKVCVTHK